MRSTHQLGATPVLRRPLLLAPRLHHHRDTRSPVKVLGDWSSAFSETDILAGGVLWEVLQEVLQTGTDCLRLKIVRQESNQQNVRWDGLLLMPNQAQRSAAVVPKGTLSRPHRCILKLDRSYGELHAQTPKDLHDRVVARLGPWSERFVEAFAA